MKFVPAVIAVLLLFHFDGIKSDDESFPKPLPTPGPLPSMNSTANTSIEEIKTTTAAPKQDSLDNISIKDLLKPGTDANRKIINEIRNFPPNHLSYSQPLILTTAGYVFPKALVKYNLEEGYITFYNITVSHWYDKPLTEDRKLKFSYSLSCDSSAKAKISVGIPTNVRVLANFSIIHPLKEWINEGSVDIVIKNGTISKSESDVFTANAQINDTLELFFTDLKFGVKFNGIARFQPPLHDKLKTFFVEVQSSLKEFFYQQLNQQMVEYGLNPSSNCEEIQFMEPNVKKMNSLFYNNYLNNLYIIPEAKVEKWKGAVLSLGPIVLAGFSFNSTEFSVSKDSCYDPSNEDAYKVQLSSRIKTGKLDGKFEWYYNLNGENWNNFPHVFSFSIDNILFENNYAMDTSSGMPPPIMNIHLGDVKIKPMVNVTNFDIQEVKFAKFVISEYLKSAIAESLIKSLSDVSYDGQASLLEIFSYNF